LHYYSKIDFNAKSLYETVQKVYFDTLLSSLRSE